MEIHSGICTFPVFASRTRFFVKAWRRRARRSRESVSSNEFREKSSAWSSAVVTPGCIWDDGRNTCASLTFCCCCNLKGTFNLFLNLLQLVQLCVRRRSCAKTEKLKFTSGLVGTRNVTVTFAWLVLLPYIMRVIGSNPHLCLGCDTVLTSRLIGCCFVSTSNIN